MIQRLIIGLLVWGFVGGDVTILDQTVAQAQGVANNRMPARDFAQKAVAPYRIDVSPPTRGVDSATITLKPVPTGTAAIAEKMCALSVRPANGTGSTWQGPADPTCALDAFVRLPIGQYVIRLAILWKVSGNTAGLNQVQELPYEVRAGDRLKVRSLTLDRGPLATNSDGKVIVEIANIGPVAAPRFSVKGIFRSANGSKVVMEKQIAPLQPGAVYRDGISLFPVRSGRSALAIEVDMANVAGEGSEFLTNNKFELSFDVTPGSPPKPFIATGSTRVQEVPHMNSWEIPYAVCNVDPEASYAVTLRCLDNCADPGLSLNAAAPSIPMCTPLGDCGGGYLPDGGGLCPPNLPFPGAIQPPRLKRFISPHAAHDYELAVQAEKVRGPLGFTRDVRIIHVPKICDFPPCTRTEGYRYEGISVR
ncbi:MAG: CARDB domain-containing protein [Nitrospira sp.]|nr:CARDB domain-containing protein [Nitrospira sp.]